MHADAAKALSKEAYKSFVEKTKKFIYERIESHAHLCYSEVTVNIANLESLDQTHIVDELKRNGYTISWDSNDNLVISW